MVIEEQHQGAVIVLKPYGPVTEAEAEEFKQRLADVLSKSLGRLVVDLSAIPFVGSDALEVLVEFSEQLAGSGRALKLCAANQTLREVLKLTDLTPWFEMFEEPGAAVRSFL